VRGLSIRLRSLQDARRLPEDLFLGVAGHLLESLVYVLDARTRLIERGRLGDNDRFLRLLGRLRQNAKPLLFFLSRGNECR